ncbi:DUF4276 family protein [Sorangium sp. So ce118]
MIRLYVIVEGDTEQEFVKRCLAPHLDGRQVWTTPIEVTTRRDRKTGQKLGRGGGHWKHWQKDIRKVLRSNATDIRVTSLFDLYGLPEDFPKLDDCTAERDTVVRAGLLETAMRDDIEDPRFIPYVQRHEFEALVLSGLEHLGEQLIDADARAGLEALRTELGDTPPEDVNDGPETAPSKRLLARVPGYNKKAHGPQITEKVGVDGLKQRCPRFGAWVALLEALGEQQS